MLRDHDENCREIYAEKIVIFNSKYAAASTKKELPTDPKYDELAKADFDIRTDDQVLKDKFEAIKRCILDNREEP